MQVEESRTCGLPLEGISSELTLLPADFPARTSALPTLTGHVGLMAHGAAYSSVSQSSLTTYDQEQSYWKTSQLSLTGEWEEYSEPWPRSGLMRNGNVFRRVPLALTTKGTGYGSLPTPARRDGRDVSSGQAFLSQRRSHSPSLATTLLEAGATFRQLYNAYRIAMGFPSGWSDALFNHTETR